MALYLLKKYFIKALEKNSPTKFLSKKNVFKCQVLNAPRSEHLHVGTIVSLCLCAERSEHAMAEIVA